MPNENQLYRKIAIVTGGSRGLGRNTAISLAGTGVDVILTYQTNRSDAESAVAEIQSLGRRAIALQFDAGDISSFDGFAADVRKALEHLDRERFDFLINNAGAAYYASVADTTEEEFDKLFNVHLKGVFFLTQKLLPLIEDGGRIVNVSSGLARFCAPGFAAYAAMKGGVEVLTRYLAKELGSRGITVNTVAPGAIETDFGGGAVRDNPHYNQAVADATALGRAGVPDDIGPMIASLLSEANRWINAQRIEVSGGAYL